MVSEPVVEFDRSVLGQEIDGGTFEIDGAKLQAFAEAVGETNPIYSSEEAAKAAGYDSIIAPPAFLNTLIIGSGRPDPKVDFGTLTFHSGQALEVYCPVKAGDTIRAVTSLEDIYAKTGRSGTMVFIVWKTTLINQEDAQVAVARESFVRR